MKFIAAVAILALVCVAFAADQLVIDQALIKTVNSHPRATWVAGENEVFKGKTLSQIRHMFGLYLMDKEFQQSRVDKRSANLTASDLPKEFDSGKQWSQCKTINGIRNQGQCGSCWAFSGAEVLSDRFCIATSGAVNEPLSPQDMVSCDKGDYACQGGYLDRLWQYLENTGIVTDKCLPYKSGSGSVPACPSKCDAGSGADFKKYKAKAGSTVQYASVEDAQADIAAHGPIQTGFKVYRDFFTYKSGVYRHVSGGFAGGHAVKITGWGVDAKTNTPYWIVANSWGTTFGLNGFFWIERGTDECDFESNLIAAQADA